MTNEPPETAQTADLPQEPRTRQWIDWPICPECGKPRQTICPACEAAGTDFPLADENAPAEKHRETRARQATTASSNDAGTREIVLTCPECDETFRPTFYRLCENCGHDFGFGIELTGQRDELYSRAVLIVAALTIAATAGLFLYWVINR